MVVIPSWHTIFFIILEKYLPLHNSPSLSSMYPVLQLQENDPAVLVHIWEQPPLLVEHSFISVEKKTNCQVCTQCYTDTQENDPAELVSL